MTDLSKKALVVAFMGLGAFVVTRFIPRWYGKESQQAALQRLDSECRVYRSAPLHRNADVCRAYDLYAPHATRLQHDIDRYLDEAKLAAARGDHHAAEMHLRGALAALPDLDAVGTFIAALVGSTAIKRTLDVLDAHPSLDRSFVLRDVHFELAQHPLEGAALQRRWSIAHQEKLSQSEVADQLEVVARASHDMERAAFRFDETSCKAAVPAEEPDVCNRLVTLAQTSARLDAMRR